MYKKRFCADKQDDALAKTKAVGRQAELKVTIDAEVPEVMIGTGNDAGTWTVCVIGPIGAGANIFQVNVLLLQCLTCQ